MLSEYLLLLTTAVVFNTCTAVLYPPNPLKLRVVSNSFFFNFPNTMEPT
jgi:hypothetical protein